MNVSDIRFLLELKKELNAQPNDGSADPLFWGIMEKHKIPAYEGCGDGSYVVWESESYYDEDLELLKYDMIEAAESKLSEAGYAEFIEEVNKLSDIYELYQFGAFGSVENEPLLSNIFDFELYEYRNVDLLSRYTGAFVTKRAAKEYLNNFGYNHPKGRTYAMTATRNFEYERLLKIIKETDWEWLLKEMLSQ